MAEFHACERALSVVSWSTRLRYPRIPTQRKEHRKGVTSSAFPDFLTLGENLIFICFLVADDDVGSLNLLAIDFSLGETQGGFPGKSDDLDGIGPVVGGDGETAPGAVARAARVH